MICSMNVAPRVHEHVRIFGKYCYGKDKGEGQGRPSSGPHMNYHHTHGYRGEQPMVDHLSSLSSLKYLALCSESAGQISFVNHFILKENGEDYDLAQDITSSE